MGARWSREAEQYIREHYADETAVEIARKLGRTPAAVRNRIVSLGLWKHGTRPENGRRWTPKEEAYLEENWETKNDEELAAAVGRSAAAVCRHRKTLGLMWKKGCRGPNWTPEELKTLEDLWGEKPAPQIAGILGRNLKSVRIKALRLGYAGQKKMGEMMSASAVARLLGVSPHTVTREWIAKRGLLAKRCRLGEGKKITVIILFQNLLKWLETHQNLWDSRKVELFGLGVEYDWLTEKRKRDAEIPPSRAWTPEEDARLLYLYKNTAMTHAQIAEELGRTLNAVRSRLYGMDVWGTGKRVARGRKSEREAVK